MFFQNKAVLVTGGTGFVGSHLVQDLLDQGARVRVTVHRRPLPTSHERLETMPADLTSPEDCSAAVRGMQYVFHGAGTTGTAGISHLAAMADLITNIDLTARMLEACWKEKVERFLLFSSSTGYPPADHPVGEEEFWAAPPHPAFLGYGWMRRYLERLAEFVASRSGLGIAIVRPTAVYGRNDNFDPARSHVIPGLIHRALLREDPFVVWGTGNEIRDFLHVSDLTRGCLLMLEKNATCDPVNIGYGMALTIREIVETILAATGHHEAKVIFDATKPTTIPVRMVDTGKARRLLGFEPSVSFAEGIRDTVEWYCPRFGRTHSPI